MTEPREVPRSREAPAALGMTSPERVQDIEARRILAEMQAAIESIASLMPAASESTQQSPVSSVETITNVEIYRGNRIRIYKRRIYFSDGKMVKDTGEMLLKEIELPLQTSSGGGGGTTVVFGTVPYHDHQGPTSGGWAGHLSGAR